MNDYEPPKVGDVYEVNRYADFKVLLCIAARQRTCLSGEYAYTYDFLVLDGCHPPIRTWTSGGFSTCTMEEAMRNFQFKKIACDA